MTARHEAIEMQRDGTHVLASNALRLTVAAVLAAAVLAVTVLAGTQPDGARSAGVGPRPANAEPSSIARVKVAAPFVVPFEATVPADPSVRLMFEGTSLVAWAKFAAPGTTIEAREPGTIAGAAGGSPGDGTVAGIAVASADTAWGHSKRSGEGRVRMPTDRDGFIAGLRDMLGVMLGPPNDATVDGRLGVVVDVEGPPTVDLHLGASMTGLVGSNVLYIGLPGRLFVVDVGEATVLIQVWGRTDGDLAAFLPEAKELIDSIRFAAP